MKLLSDRARGLFVGPPRVLQRWIRFKIVSQAPWLARAYMRPRIALRERDQRLALRQTFETMRGLAVRYERDGHTASLAVLNVALYFLIAERDIQAVKLDALTHSDPWVRGLALRTILLTIHEWRMGEAAGKQLQAAFEELGIAPATKTRANAALSSIHHVQKRAAKEFHELRNNTIAHRDRDALRQYRAIRNVRPDVVFKLTGDFYDAADEFISLLPDLIAEAGQLRALVRQTLRRARRMS